jgi:hypothetical protein
MPANYNDAFKDIPGTVVFDATQSRLGYHLNMFCMSLMKADSRAAFKADERAYLLKFPMTDAQREAVLARLQPDDRARWQYLFPRQDRSDRRLLVPESRIEDDRHARGRIQGDDDRGRAARQG